MLKPEYLRCKNVVSRRKSFRFHSGQDRRFSYNSTIHPRFYKGQLKNMNNKRKSIYEEIYSPSSEEEQPSSSYAKDSKIGVGDFLLVKVYVDKSRNKVFTYACKAITDVEEDGEVKVMFLRVVDENAKRFRIDDKDISYIL